MRSSGTPALMPNESSSETALSARTGSASWSRSPIWSAGPGMLSALAVTTTALRQWSEYSRPLAFTVTVT